MEVIFRVSKDGELFAAFPVFHDTKREFIQIYTEEGQHVPCSIDYVLEESKAAKKEQSESLLNELHSIGYLNLSVLSGLKEFKKHLRISQCL